MSRLLTAAAAVVLALLLYAGFRSLGPAPPLGAFLDPARGVWATAATVELPRQATARVPGLGAETRVLYDRRGVPHIFASTVEDAVRALGFVVARDRLFQMELSARAGGGRLTELAGARAIAADETPRRLGQRWAAERKLAALDPRSQGARVLRAYAEGVNAWVDAMTPAELPVEYRLLSARPARWEPVHTMELLERMAWTLSYDRLELDRARVAALVGAPAARALFPVNSPIVEPIVPNGQREARIDAAPMPAPGAPDSAAAVIASLRARAAGLGASPGVERGTVGSNSWAVAPARSASGHALLAGDPHLDLTLPSIWYEAHLVVPGVMDVYGVTIPGAPGIVIGFNRDVAWTFTNAYADVMDYWEETVDEPARPTRYRLDGAWRPLIVREERYLDPRGRVIRSDTLYITHRGPMLREDGRWYSFRWTALEPSSELDAFAAAARATSARELLDSMAAYYAVPAQTMLAADRAGHVGIRATGQVPERPNGDGLQIRDGSTRASDWIGWRPVTGWPQAFDPAQGFLASANQQPNDPRADTAYYGADFRDPWRALRINALLRADSSITPDEMRRFQTDAGSARADFFVPAFLQAAERVLARRDDAVLREAARLLGEWDRRYPRESERAVLFEAAMRELTDATFDELVRPGARRGQSRARVATPGGYVFASLFRDSTSAWWDDRDTPAVETRDDILAASLVRGLARARDQHGAPGESWRWDRVHAANINHVLGLPSFGALSLDVSGGPNTLSPTSGRGTQGASWRMVVELGPELRAWGTYPGGQSGNPASARYTDRLEQWRTGMLDTLFVPRDTASFAAGSVRASLVLTPAP
jgi:penicillin amidase